MPNNGSMSDPSQVTIGNKNTKNTTNKPSKKNFDKG